MYAGEGKHTMVPVWKSGHNFQESVFFFLNVGLGNRTHAVSLGSKGLYPPSRLARQGFIRRNVIVMITDICWAVAVGELSNLPAISLQMLQSVLWIGSFIFISLHLMQVKNEVEGKCVISHRSHIAHLQGLGLNPGHQMNRSYVCIISDFHQHHTNVA